MDPSDPSRLKDLKPALAGLVIDNKLDYKELYATIIDLILRDYIHYDEAQKAFCVLKTDGLEEYEKDLITEIFMLSDSTKELDFSFLRYRHQDLSFEFYFSYFVSRQEAGVSNNEDPTLRYRVEGSARVIRKIVDYAVEQGFYTKESGEAIKKEFDKKSKKEIASRLETAVLYISSWLTLIGSLALAVWLGYWITEKLESYLLITALIRIGLVVVALVYGFSIPAYLFRAYKAFWERMEEETIFNTNPTVRGQKMAQKYRELRDFLAAHPLQGGRLSNEFLPFAIAFGIDREFEKRFKFGKKDWEEIHEYRKKHG